MKRIVPKHYFPYTLAEQILSVAITQPAMSVHWRKVIWRLQRWVSLRLLCVYVAESQVLFCFGLCQCNDGLDPGKHLNVWLILSTLVVRLESAVPEHLELYACLATLLSWGLCTSFIVCENTNDQHRYWRWDRKLMGRQRTEKELGKTWRIQKRVNDGMNTGIGKEESSWWQWEIADHRAARRAAAVRLLSACCCVAFKLGCWDIYLETSVVCTASAPSSSHRWKQLLMKK